MPNCCELFFANHLVPFLNQTINNTFAIYFTSYSSRNSEGNSSPGVPVLLKIKKNSVISVEPPVNFQSLL